MGLEKSAIIEKAASNLADIWHLSAAERNSVMGQVRKIRLCVHISNMLLEQGLGPDEQATWFRDAMAPDSPLKGRAPIQYMMKGFKGIAKVDRYLESRRAPVLS